MKKLANAYGIALLVIFISAAVLQFLAGADIRGLMFDTDALNIPTVVDNLLAHHGSLSHWYLSPAPYLFPDAVIHVAIHPFTSGMYARLAVFAAVQIVVVFALLWWLAVRTARQRPLIVAVAITGNLTWMALLRGGPYNQLMTAGFHYGAFLVSIAVVTLTLGSTRQWSRITILGVLCFLTALSDNIYVIQTAIPLVATLALVALFDAEHRAYRMIMAAVVGATSLLGSLAYGVLIEHHTRYPLHVSTSTIRTNSAAMRSTMWGFLRTHEPIGAALLLSGIVAVFYLVRLMRGIRRTQPLALVSIFAFGSVVSTCVGLAIATSTEMTIRYFIPVFSWPVIVGGLIIFNTDLFRQKVPYVVASATALILCLNTSTFVDLHGIDRTYYPTDIACIDAALAEHNAVHGIANYWDAKYIQAFSKRNLTVAQYFDNLTPMKWITTNDYYRSKYDFAIISANMPPEYTLSLPLIEKTFGKPTTATTCGTHFVFVYSQNANSSAD